MVIKRLVIERQRAVDLGQPALESRAPRRETLHGLRVASATRKGDQFLREAVHTFQFASGLTDHNSGIAVPPWQELCDVSAALVGAVMCPASHDGFSVKG